MFKLVLLQLIVGGQGLRLLKDDKCPKMPTDYKTWDNKNAFYYGLIIDGKDAHKGPHVYDWDHMFFPNVFQGMQLVYADQNAGPLTMGVIDQLHQKCCCGFNWEAETSRHPAGRDIHPRCSNQMSCEERVALLAGMWPELYQHNGNSTCPTDLKLLTNQEVPKKKLVENLLNEYNSAIEKASSDDEKLTALARLARTWMWIHPMGSGNGRIHSLMLQREVRRLGLGCGLMLYNQNKDAFVDTEEMMVSKLKEGIEMFKKSAASGKNEWLNNENVALHVSQHKLPESLNKCAQQETFGSGGNLKFGKMDASTETEVDEDEVKKGKKGSKICS